MPRDRRVKERLRPWRRLLIGSMLLGILWGCFIGIFISPVIHAIGIAIGIILILVCNHLFHKKYCQFLKEEYDKLNVDEYAVLDSIQTKPLFPDCVSKVAVRKKDRL